MGWAMTATGLSSRSSATTDAMVLPRRTRIPASISCRPAPRLCARAMADTRPSRVPAMEDSSRRAAGSILEELRVIDQDPPKAQVFLADHLLGRGAILQIAAMRPGDGQGQRAPPVPAGATGELHRELRARHDETIAQRRAVPEHLVRHRPDRAVGARHVLERHAA